MSSEGLESLLARVCAEMDLERETEQEVLAEIRAHLGSTV